MELGQPKRSDPEIRPLQPSTQPGESAVFDLRRSLLSLLNEAFPISVGHDFFEDFPVWDPLHGASVIRLGAFDGQTLVGTASARITELRADEAPASPWRTEGVAPNRARTLKVGIIGAVATHAERRGRGIATRLVSELVHELKQNGCSVVMLWGSEHALYRRIGFELCGPQERVPISAVIQRLSAEHSAGAMDVQEGWNPSLFRMLQGRWGGLSLNDSDRQWLSAHQNVRWFWCGPAHTPIAYAALGRGIDLQGLVHEWGAAEPRAFLSVLKAVQAAQPEAELLGSPLLLRSMGLPVSEHQEYLCLMRVLDPAAVLEAYGIHGARCEEHDGRWKIHLPNRECPGELEAHQLGSVLFGPLPLWIWGLDAA